MLNLPKPSLGQIATGAGDSEFPELWRGLIMACDAGINDRTDRWTDWSGKGNHWTTLQNIAWINDEKRGLYFNGSNSGCATTGNVIVGGKYLSAFFRLKSTGNETTMRMLLEASNEWYSNANAFIIYLNESANTLATGRSTTNTNFNVRTRSLANWINKPISLSVSMLAREGVAEHLDAYQAGAIGQTNQVSTYSSFNFGYVGNYRWYLGCRALGSSYAFLGTMYEVMVWNRVLNPQEHQLLAMGASPLQKRRRLWLFVRSGTSLTPITATRQVVSAVRAGVVGSRQAVVGVRASVQGGRQVVASVRASAIGTHQIRANTLLGLTGSRQIKTTVCLDLSATRSLSASVRAGVSASRSIVASVRYGLRATCKVVVKIEGFAIVKTGATLSLSSPLSDLLLDADVCALELALESTELIFDTDDMKTFTTDPYLDFTLKVDGDAPDFTGKTIIIVGSINGAVMFRKTAEVTDAQAGKVRIRLDDSEIDTVGKMLIVAHMKDAATGRNTPFPSDGYVIVPVEDSLVKP